MCEKLHPWLYRKMHAGKLFLWRSPVAAKLTLSTTSWFCELLVFFHYHQKLHFLVQAFLFAWYIKLNSLDNEFVTILSNLYEVSKMNWSSPCKWEQKGSHFLFGELPRGGVYPHTNNSAMNHWQAGVTYHWARAMVHLSTRGITKLQVGCSSMNDFLKVLVSHYYRSRPSALAM